METIVVKGSDFSFSNKRYMENSNYKDLNVVFVYPNGTTTTISTNKEVFFKFLEMKTSIIYE
jgi:hypothetical protein